MTVGLIGRKVGMTRRYDGAGRVRPVTVLEFEPNHITQLRTPERDGYTAVQLGTRGDSKHLTRPERGHLRGAKVETVATRLGEFRVDDTGALTLGQELTVEQFEPGQFVDDSGVTKGRGFAGGVRRWNFRGGPKTHGQSDRHRAPGSIGAGTTPGKVWKGQKMAGHMGNRSKTALNLLVVQVDAARNLLFVQGSVPGHANALISVVPARRKPLADFQAPEPLPEPEALAADAPVVVDEVAPEAAADEAAADEAAAPDEAAADEAATDEAAADEAAPDEAAADEADADEAAPDEDDAEKAE